MARDWKPDMERFNGAIDGVAKVDEEGNLMREAGLQEWLDDNLEDDMQE